MSLQPRVSAGQRLRIKADTFNAFLDAAAAHKASLMSRKAETGDIERPGTILVRNDSGTDADRFSILGLGDPLISPTDNEREFQNRVAFIAITPDPDAHAHAFCVLQEPIASGSLGLAMVCGVTPASVSVSDAAHEWAKVTATGLVSDAKEGGARILWKESGTGDSWAIVRFVDAAGSSMPEGAELDTLRMLENDDGDVVPTFAPVLQWGQIAVRSPSHSTDGIGQTTWVTPTTEDGKLFDPVTADKDGYGSTLGFYSSKADGIDIGIQANVDQDIPGMHNTDDLEIHLRLAKRAGPGVLAVRTAAEAVPTMLKCTNNGWVLMHGGPSGITWGPMNGAYIQSGSIGDDQIADVDWFKIFNVPSFGGDLSGTITNAQLRAGVVGSGEIANGAVTNAHIVSMDWSKVTGKPSLVNTIQMTSNSGVCFSDGYYDPKSGTVTLDFMPFTQQGQVIICTGQNPINSKYRGTALDFPESGSRNAVFVADSATGLPKWVKALEIGTATDGGATLKINYAAGKYVEISSTGKLTCYDASNRMLEVDMANSSIKATFANTNSVKIAASDFVGSSKAVKLRELAVCDTSGNAKKILALCSDYY